MGFFTRLTRKMCALCYAVLTKQTCTRTTKQIVRIVRSQLTYSEMVAGVTTESTSSVLPLWSTLGSGVKLTA